MDDGVKRLIEANHVFGFRFFAECVKRAPDRNVFVSPLSVAMALLVAYNGAKGETREAMAKALGVRDVELEELNRANATLLAELRDIDPQVQVLIANSFWAALGVPFEEEFLKTNEEFYGAEISNIDFTDPEAVGSINDWVSEKTRGKISKIVDESILGTVMLILNAVYFKGTWNMKFEKFRTHDETFTLLDGGQKKHPMMFQSGSYNYHRGVNFQAVRLPYGHERMAMYVFLPDEESSLGEFRKSLNMKNWRRWLSRFKGMRGRIGLPRFKVEYGAKVNDVLTTMGMGVALDPMRADFEDMTPVKPNVYIGEVRHKTFLEVNEEGSEAAATTSVSLPMGGPIEYNWFTMIVNRPFFCAIVHEDTGALLFMGSIVDPEER